MWESIRAGFVLMVIAAFIGSFKLSVKWKYFCIMSMLLKTPLPNWGQTQSPYLWGTGRDVEVPPSWVKSSTWCLSLLQPSTSQLGRLAGWVLPFNLEEKHHLPVPHFWCTHYIAESPELDPFCHTVPLFPAAQFLVGCFCSFLEIKLNLWKRAKSGRCSYKIHIFNFEFCLC